MNFIPVVATSVAGTYDESIPEATVVSVITAHALSNHRRLTTEKEKLRFQANVLKSNGKYKEAFEKLALANELEYNYQTLSTIPSAPHMPPPPIIPSAPPMPPPPIIPAPPPAPHESDSESDEPILFLSQHGVGNTGVRDANNALGDVFTSQGLSNQV